MGLFGKIKKGLSGAWKGVKKAAKSVARTVKSVAKKVATATPWGAKLWKEGGRLGKKIIKGIGKLGPVGMIAAQAVLASTGIGASLSAAMGSMWSSFGASAANAAANSSLLGSLGTAIYNGVNYVGGSLGAIGDAISQGASELAAGNFSSAASTFGKNMSRALSGTAGNTAMAQGAAIANLGDAVSAPLQSTMGANSTESLLSQAAGGPASGMASAVTTAPVSAPAATSLLGTVAEAGKTVKSMLDSVTPEYEPPQPYQPTYSPMAPLNTQFTPLSAPTQSTAVTAATLRGY